MNTLQIKCFLRNNSKTNFGLVKIPTFPSAYVINSDPSSEPGEHWVAVYFDKRGRGECFDSYRLSPIGWSVLKSYMDTYSLSAWIYNRKTLQAYF